MEVHPPEHSIHNWRDFFVHIGTITIGLLIALGLEGLVEFYHHRELVHTARRDLRNEMLSNSKVLDGDERDLTFVHNSLLQDLTTLRALQATHTSTSPRLVSTWTWDGFSESAFTTARETNALAYMQYEQVQDLDLLYRQQQLVEESAGSYIRDVNRIRLPLQGGRTLPEASPEDLKQMIATCSDALLDIDLLKSLMISLHSDYKRLSAPEGQGQD